MHVSRSAVLLIVAVILTACATSSTQRKTTSTTQTPSSGRGGFYQDDGPGEPPPAHILEAVPDAVPRQEPLHKFANRPYEVFGQTYVPVALPAGVRLSGHASWYGRKFHGARTASGEIYDMYAMTAAHPTLPIPSYARVTNLQNGRSVIVRINDRGPFLRGRLIDLSYTAAFKLGYAQQGSAWVEVESITALPPRASAPAVVAGVAPEVSPQPVPTRANIESHFVQLGVFRNLSGAESLQRRLQSQLQGLGAPVHIRNDNGLQRVQVGPYKSTEEASLIARRISSETGFDTTLTRF